MTKCYSNSSCHIHFAQLDQQLDFCKKTVIREMTNYVSGGTFDLTHHKKKLNNGTKLSAERRYFHLHILFHDTVNKLYFITVTMQLTGKKSRIPASELINPVFQIGYDILIPKQRRAAIFTSGIFCRIPAGFLTISDLSFRQ